MSRFNAPTFTQVEALANLRTAREYLADLAASGKVREAGQPMTEDSPSDALLMETWGIRTECGTTACIGGWLTTCPVLRELGLRAYGEVESHSLILEMAPTFLPTGSALELLGADETLGILFDLTEDETSFLFSGFWPSSFTQALERFDRVVAAHEAGEAWVPHDERDIPEVLRGR